MAPYFNWRARNHSQLVAVVKKHKTLHKKWSHHFFRECRQYSELNGLPLLFDIEDMRSVLKELEPKGSRNNGKKFDRLMGQAIHEADLIGNVEKCEEIISRIADM